MGKCGEIKEGLLHLGFGISDFGFIKGLFSDLYREKKVKGSGAMYQVSRHGFWAKG